MVKKMIKKIISILLAVLPICLWSDIQLRVMTYNSLHFSGTSTNRVPYFQAIINEIDPDILVMQEIENNAGVMLMLQTINEDNNEYANAEFYDGYDTDNALFYKIEKVTLISQDVIPTDLREIGEYTLSSGSNLFRIYSCHLKAGATNDNEQDRLEEVTILRNHLNQFPDEEEFIICGDMNFYTNEELAYQKFMAEEEVNIGRCEDTTDQVGEWHDNPDYAEIHTQSPRSGSNGGMDDRFDFVITSFGINNSSGIEYVENSLTPFGNDGLHFNMGINDGTNYVVSGEIADALVSASDHIPVYADFISKAINVDFIADITSGPAPLTVSFTDMCSPDPIYWEWDFDNDGIIDSQSQNPEWTYFDYGIYSVSLSVSDGNNSGTLTKEAYISVSDNPPMQIISLPDISFNEDSFPNPLDLNQYFSDPDGDAIEFAYSGNNNIIADIENGMLNISSNLNWFGSDTLIIVASNIAGTISDTTVVNVYPVNDAPLIVNYTPVEQQIILNDTTSVSFSVIVEDPDSEVGYNWFVDEVIQLDHESEMTINFNTSNQYLIRCEVIDEYDSDEIEWEVIVDITSIQQYINPEISFKIYPNPFYKKNFRSKLMAEIACSSDKVATISIYNIKGKKISSKNITLCKGINNFELETFLGFTNKATEVYLIRCVTADFTYTRKICIIND